LKKTKSPCGSVHP